ncbi:hypothetical protein Tco_0200043 [Tanacetum coccineum]
MSLLGRFLYLGVLCFEVTPIVDSVAHYINGGVTDWYQEPKVEPNQPDLAPDIPEPALVDENEEPKEEEGFEDKDEFEEEEPQEEENMKVDIKEEENELELTFPYEEADPLNPPPPASNSESEDVVEVEDMVEPKDEIVPNSVHETVHALVEKKGKAKDKYYGKLIADLGNEVRCSMRERETVLEDLIKEFGNVEERVEGKKLKKELEEARLRSTLLRMQKERVERDLYWTRVQAHEFYQEMIRRGVVFEKRLNEAIDVSVKDEESPSSDQRGSPRDY